MSQINLIEFPKLGLSFQLSNVAFSIFGIDIYWYGVLIGIGMALGVLFALKHATAFGIDADHMIDVIFVGFVCAIVCGRLYYVLFVDTSYRTFFELIDLRSGGIAIYGGIIGAFAGALAGCKWRKVPILPMFDVVSMGFLIGQGIGRWGNFFNQEAFGSNTNGIFGMISPATVRYLQVREDWLSSHGMYVDPFLPVHPTFLYESAWCLLGLFLLWRYLPKRRFNGEIFLFYVIWYGAGRFVIEGLRTDPLLLPGLDMPVSRLVAALSAAAGLLIWCLARRKTAGQPLAVPEIPPHTATVQVPTEDGVTAVTISWPANSRTPGKEERLSLARTVLQAEAAKGEAVEETDDTPGTADETPGEANESPDEPDAAGQEKTETDEPKPESGDATTEAAAEEPNHDKSDSPEKPDKSGDEPCDKSCDHSSAKHAK